MAQPTDLPEWNTGGANRTAPSSGEKTAGYAVNQVPSSGKLNWLLFTLYLWALYLKNLAGEVFTWTAAHTFGSTLTVTGTTTLNGAANLNGATTTAAALTANQGVGVPPAQNFKYTTPRTFTLLVGADQFFPVTGSPPPTLLPSSDGLFLASETSVGPTLHANIRLPAGALITGISVFYKSTDSVTKNPYVEARISKYASSGAVLASTVISTFALHAIAAGATIWEPLALLAAAGTTDMTDALLSLRPQLSATTVAGNLLFGGARITYTLNNLVP